MYEFMSINSYDVIHIKKLIPYGVWEPDKAIVRKLLKSSWHLFMFLYLYKNIPQVETSSDIIFIGLIYHNSFYAKACQKPIFKYFLQLLYDKALWESSDFGVTRKKL